VSFVFSAMKMDKEATRLVEEAYAGAGIPVVSNNSAHRWTHDVPMIIPEINAHHLELIGHQKESRGWDRGFIVVKPNCSIQSYVPVLHALRSFGLDTVIVATYQAVSGAGRTLSSWPEMSDNIIPFIPGEEKKSEIEPLKIWGSVQNGQMILATKPIISTTCIRVPVSDGHLVSVHARFDYKTHTGRDHQSD